MARYCDIVMKGGITSGIVYPAAVAEIAKDFTFKNVGGTSAGAIAAAITAAAERRRARDGSTAGFDRVGACPEYLATDDHLLKLFAPNTSTRALFHTVLALLGRPRFRPAFLAKWAGLVWAYPLASLIGAVPGVAFLVAVLRSHADPWMYAAALVLAVATVLAGITIAIALALVLDLLKKLPANFYGMVTGVDDHDRKSLAALCTWLERELELIAGIEPGTVPLTFGMLWDAKRGLNEPGLRERPPSPDVNLEMVTTNVTWGRPYKFPFETVFFYDPEELRRFFPDHVVEWMRARPRAPRGPKEETTFAAYANQKPAKLPLPVAADLPVIVATRMSLAFPVLMCAVPLYGADFTLPVPADGIQALEHCWFSDGGISSNFPIALFDEPLPRWPTFAINLAPFHPAHPQQPDESQNVYMPANNAAGRLPTFSRFGSLPGFAGAIFNAMQNWNDNTQMRLPGYRDRIVTVFLANDEGGLNLDMPPDVLARLRARGAAAGALIASRFKAPSTLPPGAGDMNWENHRWLRFRSTMGAAKSYLSEFADGLRNPEPPDVTYDALIAASDGTPAHRYPLPASARAPAGSLADRAAQLGEDLRALDALDTDLPRPVPDLVVRPSLDA